MHMHRSFQAQTLILAHTCAHTLTHARALAVQSTFRYDERLHKGIDLTEACGGR